MIFIEKLSVYKNNDHVLYVFFYILIVCIAICVCTACTGTLTLCVSRGEQTSTRPVFPPLSIFIFGDRALSLELTVWIWLSPPSLPGYPGYRRALPPQLSSRGREAGRGFWCLLASSPCHILYHYKRKRDQEYQQLHNLTHQLGINA